MKIIRKYCYLGFEEFISALMFKDAWLYLGIQDIKLRYRRSIIGPWWVTISTAVMILALGFLWSNIFITDIKTYMPFFAVGLVFWNWISAQLSDAITGFTQFEAVIKQTNLPFPIYLYRLCIRNAIILAHNLLVVIFILFVIGNGLNLNSLWVLPAIILVQFLILMLCTCISIVCTRYRDLNQVILSILQISFFFSPIIWQPNSLKGHLELIELNPVFHWLEIIREPLLGNQATLFNWEFVIINTVVVFFITIYLLGKSKSNISVWL